MLCVCSVQKHWLLLNTHTPDFSRLPVGGNMIPEGGAAPWITAHSLILECLSCFSYTHYDPAQRRQSRLLLSTSIWPVSCGRRDDRLLWHSAFSRCSSTEAWNGVWYRSRGAKSRLSWRTTCELCNDLWRGWWLLQHNSRPSFGTLPTWQSKSGAPFHCTGTVSPQRQTEAKRANFSFFFFLNTRDWWKVGCFFFLFFTASWQGAVHWITFLSTKPKPFWCFAGRE